MPPLPPPATRRRCRPNPLAGARSRHQSFTLTPRLNFTSTEPGCGKTTALDFLATLSHNVLRTDNLKTAVLFRVVEQQQPTLLLDELDSYLHLFPDLRGLINSGNSDSGYAHRCEGNIVRAFKSFAATALAGIGDLAKTLRDRSIIIPLAKAPLGTLKVRFDKRKVETETILGRKIARWVQDNFAAIAACDPIMPPAAHNRLGDNWRPLFAIAQLIGGHWPQRIVDAFTELTPSLTSASSPSQPDASPTAPGPTSQNQPDRKSRTFCSLTSALCLPNQGRTACCPARW